MDYALAAFCYGERYYQQTNRLIESVDSVDEKPEFFIVTDNPSALLKRDFVKTKNIGDYNSKYSDYKNNYYDFDFSVKRFSLLFAFENNYNNVILTDTDVIPNYPLFKTENIMNAFVKNTIGGPVTYSFRNEQGSNSMLGDRFKYYEKKFKIVFDRDQLNEMVEDCIQYISIEDNFKFKFINIWDKCIQIKDEDGLPNAPAGNIDEMCFSALYNNLGVLNTSNTSLNLLVAHHDKWY